MKLEIVLQFLLLLSLSSCDEPLEPYTSSGSGSGDDILLSPRLPELLPSVFIKLFYNNLTQQQYRDNIEDTLPNLIHRLLDLETVPFSMFSRVSSVSTVLVYFLNVTTTCSDIETYGSDLRSSQDMEWISLGQTYVLLAVEVQCELVSIPWWHWLIIAISAFIGLSAFHLMIIAVCCRCTNSKNKKKTKASYMKTSDFLLRETTTKLEEQTRQVLVRKVSRVSFQSRTQAHFYSHLLSISDLEGLLTSPSSLFSEYASIPSNMVTMAEIPAGAEDKNRYRDVLPNPQTRVALFLKFGVPNSDYINANYIRGYKEVSKAYIATQGPLQWTVADFWRMVWEQKSPMIVMMTKFEEKGMLKCVQYWPEDRLGHSIVYEELEVVLKRRISTATYSTTTLLLRHKNKMVSREVTHFWFTGWPDHGVPSSPKSVVDFISDVRKSIRDIPGPTVVHCSAGIGRTGVFIAANIGIQQIDEQGEVDVLRILSSLRQDRGGMIQTKQQYVFLYQVLLEYTSKFHPGKVSQSTYKLESPREEDETFDMDTRSLLP